MPPRPSNSSSSPAGGTRCFWQGGFLDVARAALAPDPQRIVGVSGGALGSAAFVAHRGTDLLDIMQRRFADHDRNVDWNEVVNEDEGWTLHQRVYREVAEELLDAATLARVADGPDLQVVIGHPPGDGKLSATAATLAYEAELHTVASPHLSWAPKLGVETARIDARAAARHGTLADLCVAAATIPPLFDLPGWGGRPVIDGGMADQAPMPDPDEGDTLILLTRHYRGLEEVPGRLYLQPEEDVPADKIDFTDPAKIGNTWEAGRRAAGRFLREHGYGPERES